MLANFKKKERIGSGCFGSVYKAKWNGDLVAVKILHERLFEPLDPRKHVAEFEAECKVLQKLQHRNIVKLLEFVITHSSPPMLITELLDCDLRRYIANLHPGKIPYSETVSIMFDVAEGLTYLHQQNPSIVHRDLAPKNVLLTKQRQAKIADVGLAKVLQGNEQIYASPVPGTLVYAAPETYHREYHPRWRTSKRVEYGTKIDIFSFGIMLMEVINGKLPSPQPAEYPFTIDGQQIPEKERRKGDIEMMGEHKLKGIVVWCIEDFSDKRPCAEELAELFQREWSKIQQKEIVGEGTRPTIEVAVLGQAHVGKSSLILRYFNNTFDDRIIATIGVDYKTNSSFFINGRQFTLRVIDTAGQEKFQSTTPASIRKSQGIVVVYDVTDRASLYEGVPEMLQLIKKTRPDNPSMILVGNKADLSESKQSKRAITEKEREDYAQKLGIHSIETSAFSGKNVKRMFEMIATEIYGNLDLSDIDEYISRRKKVDISAAETPPTTENTTTTSATSSSCFC